jgi:hypothetical protein
MGRDDSRETTIKGNDNDGWSFDGVLLWLERRQNRDTVEWWGEWARLRWPFYSSGGWKWDNLGRVADNDGTNLMLQFQLKRGGDVMKHCQKMKRRQRACLDSMRNKCDMAQRCGDIGRTRDGSRGGDDGSWVDTNLTKPKNKKIHEVNSTITNRQWIFKAIMS